MDAIFLTPIQNSGVTSINLNKPPCLLFNKSKIPSRGKSKRIDLNSTTSITKYLRLMESQTKTSKQIDTRTKFLNRFYSGEKDVYNLGANNVSLPFTCSFNKTCTSNPLLIVAYEAGNVIILDTSVKSTDKASLNMI